MMYQVKYLSSVYKTFEKIDKFTKRILLEWNEKTVSDALTQEFMENHYLRIVKDNGDTALVTIESLLK